MYPNWHVLGVDVSQPLAFPAVQCTAHMLQRANYIYTQNVKQWEVCAYGSAD